VIETGRVSVRGELIRRMLLVPTDDAVEQRGRRGGVAVGGGLQSDAGRHLSGEIAGSRGGSASQT